MKQRKYVINGIESSDLDVFVTNLMEEDNGHLTEICQEVIKRRMNKYIKMDKIECENCLFLNKVFSDISNNKEYWLFTEMFVRLHHGKDYCDPNTQ